MMSKRTTRSLLGVVTGALVATMAPITPTAAAPWDEAWGSEDGCLTLACACVIDGDCDGIVGADTEPDPDEPWDDDVDPSGSTPDPWVDDVDPSGGDVNPPEVPTETTSSLPPADDGEDPGDLDEAQEPGDAGPSAPPPDEVGPDPTVPAPPPPRPPLDPGDLPAPPIGPGDVGGIDEVEQPPAPPWHDDVDPSGPTPPPWNDDVDPSGDPLPPAGPPRFAIEAVRFTAADESGIDWFGSDEPQFLFSTVADGGEVLTVESQVFGDVDSGDSRSFGDLCVIDDCDRGFDDPTVLSIQLFEIDGRTPDPIAERIGYVWQFLDGIENSLQYLVGVELPDWVLDGLADLQGADDLMGSITLAYDPAELVERLPVVGSSVVERHHLGGHSGDLPFEVAGGPDYVLELRIARLPNGPSELPGVDPGR